MSIEAKIDALIAALNANTAARAAGKTAEASAPKATEAAAPPAEKRPPGRPPKATAVAAPTIEAVVEAANRFLAANDKPAARALLAEHGSPNGSTAKLPENKRAAFIAAVDAVLAAAPEEEAEAGEDEDEI